MSRKECKNGQSCGIELCPLDPDLVIDSECEYYEDSGYRRSLKKETKEKSCQINQD